MGDFGGGEDDEAGRTGTGAGAALTVLAGRPFNRIAVFEPADHAIRNVIDLPESSGGEDAGGCIGAGSDGAVDDDRPLARYLLHPSFQLIERDQDCALQMDLAVFIGGAYVQEEGAAVLCQKRLRLRRLQIYRAAREGDRDGGSEQGQKHYYDSHNKTSD